MLTWSREAIRLHKFRQIPVFASLSSPRLAANPFS
jgi:hypothetical protein